jgi:hypothetical protein
MQNCPKLPHSELLWMGKLKHCDPRQQPLGQVTESQGGPASNPMKPHWPNRQTPAGQT